MEAQMLIFVGVLTALFVIGITVAARRDTLQHQKLLAEIDNEDERNTRPHPESF